MYELQILSPGGQWVTLPGLYNCRNDAHLVAAEWREKWGRPVAKGDPFRVVEAPELSMADQLERAIGP